MTGSGPGSSASDYSEPLLQSRTSEEDLQEERHSTVLLPTSKIVLVQTGLITAFDGSYTAFVVPYTVSTFQDVSRLDFLTVLDLVAGVFMFRLSPRQACENVKYIPM